MASSLFLLSGCSFANLRSDLWCSLRPHALLLSGGWHWPSATAADTEKFLEQLAAATIQTMNFPGTSLQFRLVPCFQWKAEFNTPNMTEEMPNWTDICLWNPSKTPSLVASPFLGHLVPQLFIGFNNIPVWTRWSITGFCSYWPPSSNPAPVPKQRLRSSIRCWTDNVLYFSCDVVSAVWQQCCDLSCPVDCTAVPCSLEFIELDFSLFDLFCFVVVVCLFFSPTDPVTGKANFCCCFFFLFTPSILHSRVLITKSPQS